MIRYYKKQSLCCRRPQANALQYKMRHETINTQMTIHTYHDVTTSSNENSAENKNPLLQHNTEIMAQTQAQKTQCID
ncbi:hypothetical protein VNO78_20906 [Psophocarpus tetragonolobus]|uniref:Uncharacterized protein n=1 Tax=Psophocarpus tetragonolobus TaxID=3891 RepID=A0AAN9XH63_PSOTE